MGRGRLDTLQLSIPWGKIGGLNYWLDRQYTFPSTPVAKHEVGNWVLSHYYLLAPNLHIVLMG